jgi:hypothetical protein
VWLVGLHLVFLPLTKFYLNTVGTNVYSFNNSKNN